MVNQERLLNEFLTLVKIDSLSGQERQVADYLKQKLTIMGLSVYEDQAGHKVGANAGNIIAFLEGNKSAAPVIMLSAHMDTVEPGSDVKPVIKDGVIYSEGETILGSDDKAGIAAILEAVQYIQENNITHGGIEIVFTIWEEGGLFGAKNLDSNLIKSKMAFVLDADGSPGTIITKAPSQDKIKAVVRGRSAHAGIKPEEGINAIQVAAHAIASMQLGRIDEETTCSIGVISGGKATNIIPDMVVIEGETRSLNNLKREAQTTAICDALRAAVEKFGAQVDITTELEYSSINLSEEDKAVIIAVNAAQQIGLIPRIEKTGGGSDANIFNQIGIQAVNLGIGMSKVHTIEEYITIEDLYNDARFLVEIIKTSNNIEVFKN